MQACVGLAEIDLEACCSRHQKEFFTHRRLNGIGDRWFFHGGILAGYPSPHTSTKIPKGLYKSTPGMARVAPPPPAVKPPQISVIRAESVARFLPFRSRR